MNLRDEFCHKCHVIRLSVMDGTTCIFCQEQIVPGAITFAMDALGRRLCACGMPTRSQATAKCAACYGRDYRARQNGEPLLNERGRAGRR